MFGWAARRVNYYSLQRCSCTVRAWEPRAVGVLTTASSSCAFQRATSWRPACPDVGLLSLLSPDSWRRQVLARSRGETDRDHPTARWDQQDASTYVSLCFTFFSRKRYKIMRGTFLFFFVFSVFSRSPIVVFSSVVWLVANPYHNATPVLIE